MNIGIKRLKQLIKTEVLTREQLQAFISKTGIDKASALLVSIVEKSSQNQIDSLLKLLKEMPQECQEYFYCQVMCSRNIYFPFKELLREQIEINQSIINAEIVHAIELSKKEYETIRRSLDDKSFPEEKFNQFAELPSFLIGLYLSRYAGQNVNKTEWLTAYYGNHKHFDEAFLLFLKESGEPDSLKIVNNLLKRKLSKDEIRELRKIRYSLEQTPGTGKAVTKAQSSEQPQEPSRIYKAWIGPYFHGKNLNLEILNYLPLTDNYVLCSITIKNKKILFADISILEDEKDVKKLLNVMKEPAQSMYVESDASYAMYLLDKSIRWHRKNNYPLPHQMQKYFPIISVLYDKAMKRPFSHIYTNEEFMNYQFYNEYIGNLYEKETLFSTWLVPQKIIAAFAKELESLTQGVIEIPKEQITARAKEIMKKYIDKYWTEPRKKEFAFKLHHMSYYLYNKDKEFLSRLCFSASLKMRAKEIKPSQNAFAEVMFAFSFSFYRAYQEQMKKKKQILIPGKDSQGIILPGK